MKKEEKRNYILAQLTSLPNAFQYVEVTKYIKDLETQLKKQQEIINKAIDFIKNGDLLYLATKNSVVYKNNIEIKAVVDRLNDLLQILEEKGK